MSRTMFGSSVPRGLNHMEKFRKLKLGEVALTILPMDKAEALAVARYCRENRITLFFSALLYRGSFDLCQAAERRMPREEFYSKEELEKIFDEAGEYYGGRIVLGEAGGILYWPKTYTIGQRVGEYRSVRPCRTVAEAKQDFVSYLKQFLDYERKELGRGPLVCLDSSMLFKYQVEAGVDDLCLEAMPGDPHLMIASIRGTARAFRRRWGVHIAMANYGGMWIDEIWQRRWKTTLHYCYITGADFVWPESGHYIYSHGSGQEFGFHSKETKRVRRAMREAYQFTGIHTRPPNGPRVGIGVVHGNLDGTPGLWNRYVWGQWRGKKWLFGPAEESWTFVDKFHRKEEWNKEAVRGEFDFSGNPPYGQYDVVPIEAPLEALKTYPCLVFLGWNTMTPEIYRKLKEYVRSGGHLLMFLPHLSTHTDRASDLKLFRNGDFRDLFGVKVVGKDRTDVWGFKCMAPSTLRSYKFPLWRISTDPRFMGLVTPARLQVTTARIISAYDDFYMVTAKELAARPVLVENSLGKGKAFLVATWQYPGDEGMRRFTDDILRTVLDGEQGDIRLLSSDRVRYAVYDGTHQRRKISAVYLLNTDPNCPYLAQLWIRGRTTEPFEVPANELRLAWCCGDLVLTPEDKRTDLKAWRAARGRHEFEFFSFRNQRIEVHNPTGRKLKVSVNGRSYTCGSRSRVVAEVRRTVDPTRKELFAPGFLEEPWVPYEPARMPYSKG